MSVRTATVVSAFGCIVAAICHAQASNWFEVRGGAWSPRPDVSLRIRAELQPAIAKLAGSQFERFRPWQEYKFQFQGQESDSGKFVAISALCTVDESQDLTKQFLLVLDGGTCFFEVKYDPKSHRFYDLIVHGEA
jgi:hypothetical protein